jgi:hypothetical protein
MHSHWYDLRSQAHMPVERRFLCILTFSCPPVSVLTGALQYFATRRRITTLHHALYDYTDDRPNEYKTRGSLAPLMRSSDGQAPRTCANEVVGLIGYGIIGMVHRLVLASCCMTSN